MFESRISADAIEKRSCSGEIWNKHFLMVPWYWKVMQRNTWKDIANWRTKQLNSYTKSQLHVLTFINSRKKKWDLKLENEKFAHKLFWNTCIWLVLVDLMFYGPWTSLLVSSQNGSQIVTNAQYVWFLTFITHVNSDNFVMWEIQRNTADWDYFKILILPMRIWRFEINIGVASYAFSWSHTFVSNKLDVQETDFSFTQFYGSWNNFSWCRFTDGLGYHQLWIFGIWLQKYFILSNTNSIKSKICLYREICCITPLQTSTRKTKPSFHSSTTFLICIMLTVCLRTWIFLSKCYVVRLWG